MPQCRKLGSKINGTIKGDFTLGSAIRYIPDEFVHPKLVKDWMDEAYEHDDLFDKILEKLQDRISRS